MIGRVRSDLHVGDGLGSSEKICCLPNGGDQVCSYAGVNTLVFGRVWELVEVCHGDSYVRARGLEHLLVSHHVEGVVKVVWDQLSLFFFRPLLSTIGVALLVLLSLIIGFSIEDWFIVADIKDQISSTRQKNWEAGKTWGVWWKIQVAVFVLGV